MGLAKRYMKDGSFIFNIKANTFHTRTENN